MHKDLIEYAEVIVKGLVKNPDMVSIQEFLGDDESIMLEVIVQKEDIGGVIGHGGKIAGAIRQMVRAYAYLHNINNVKINIDSF